MIEVGKKYMTLCGWPVEVDKVYPSGNLYGTLTHPDGTTARYCWDGNGRFGHGDTLPYAYDLAISTGEAAHPDKYHLSFPAMKPMDESDPKPEQVTIDGWVNVLHPEESQTEAVAFFYATRESADGNAYNRVACVPARLTYTPGEGL
jgi:hypothetical protein